MSDASKTNPEYVLPRVAAKKAGIGLTTIRKYIASGAIPHVRVGRRVLIPATWPDASWAAIQQKEKP